MHVDRSSLALAFLVSLAGTTAAQLTTFTLPTGTGNDPRSVIIIGNQHVVVSNQLDAWQHFVNVANPVSPAVTTSYNPPGSDQWYEAEYTPDYGGRLFTGHRNGGLVMTDVSNPAAPVHLQTVTTYYHYRGMRYHTDPATSRRFLFYNDTNWGMVVYELLGAGTSLSKLWDNYANGTNDGNGMEITGSTLLQYGRPNNAMTTRHLRSFDITTPPTPTELVKITTTTPNANHAFTQMRKHPLFKQLVLASRWYDGIEIIDVTNPAQPVVTPILLPDPNLVVWGSCFFPASPYAVSYGSYLVGTTRYYWWLFLLILPSSQPSVIFSGLAPMDIHDVTMDAGTGRIYVVGRDLATLTKGLLQIY
jgi:hypothetical protein